MIDLLVQYREAFMGGLAVTLLIAGVSWVLGCLAGFWIGVFAAHRSISRWALQVVSFIIASIPAIAVLYWFHYPLQNLLEIRVDPLWTTIVVLAVINTILVAETVRDTASRIAREFVEAAFATGMARNRAFRLVEFPLIVRAAAGRIISTQVNILHMTLFASLISVNEVFRVAQRVNSIEYKAIEIYTLVALFYFVVSAPLLFLAYWSDRRFGRDFAER